MYLLNIVTPHKLCGPLSTEAVLSPGSGWSWCCVTPCNCKYSQICFNFNFKIKPFRGHQRAARLHSYTVLCIVGWFSADIVSMTRALHSTRVENAGKYEDIVATFRRYDQQWKYATVISYTRTHPLVTGSRGPILELFLTDHPQPTGRHQHKSLD